MNATDKNRITEMRKQGLSYRTISRILDINENTVKTYCRRHSISRENPEMVFPRVYKRVCKNCGVSFPQYPGHREKLFCCDACRNKWWNTHLSHVKRKSMTEYTCPTCGKKFSAYGYRHRKYCSHECYITARYGKFSCE